jgi:phosphatidylglycerol:prolipoprotein diacylglycerol transferase
VIIYGLERFVLEFFREPDIQMGRYFFETVTMGQILCFLMIFLGVISFKIFSRHPIPVGQEIPRAKKGRKKRR